MTPDYDALEKLARAATPGKWYRAEAAKFPKPHQFVRSKSDDGHVDYAVAETWGGFGPNMPDASYIEAANPTVILEMIARIRSLEARCGRLREALKIYKHLRPEQQYNATGMTEDELSAELIKFPELIARGLGGSLAKEALAQDDAAMKDFKPGAMPQKAGENESIS